MRFFMRLFDEKVEFGQDPIKDWFWFAVAFFVFFPLLTLPLWLPPITWRS